MKRGIHFYEEMIVESLLISISNCSQTIISSINEIAFKNFFVKFNKKYVAPNKHLKEKLISRRVHMLQITELHFYNASSYVNRTFVITANRFDQVILEQPVQRCVKGHVPNIKRYHINRMINIPKLNHANEQFV